MVSIPQRVTIATHYFATEQQKGTSGTLRPIRKYLDKASKYKSISGTGILVIKMRQSYIHRKEFIHWHIGIFPLKRTPDIAMMWKMLEDGFNIAVWSGQLMNEHYTDPSYLGRIFKMWSYVREVCWKAPMVPITPRHIVFHWSGAGLTKMSWFVKLLALQNAYFAVDKFRI